jgi:hypothetical protein
MHVAAAVTKQQLVINDLTTVWLASPGAAQQLHGC